MTQDETIPRLGG